MNFNLPPVVRALLLINGAAFLLQQFAFRPMIEWFALAPLQAGFGPGGFMPWQLLTCGFLHWNLMHLGFNMFALFMFGQDLERLWGSKRFLNYYLVCIVSASALHMLVTSQGEAGYMVGASGGVFGVLLGFGMSFPRRIIVLLIPPVPMPAWLLVTLYGLLELYLGVTGSQSGVAHFAHLGGMLGGYLMIRHWRAPRR
jgi:membrane associated rhomboid family serine protease